MIEYFLGDESTRKPASNDPQTGDGSAGKAVPFKPRLTIKKEEKGVVIEFQNTGGANINVYGKRAYEENFTLLGTVSGSAYIDTRPNLFNAPEVREYMACLVDKENEKESPSDIVLIINK